MRILLIMPDGRIHKLKFGPLNISFREAPLTMTTLAALVPPELGAELVLADESVDRVPLEGEFDLVAISSLTGTSHRAYQLADHFRAKGATVVLGGMHPTLMPDEAALHADSVVTGFAEESWPRLLRDFAAGALRPRYSQQGMHLAGLPHPRRDLQKRLGYMVPQTVFATRGCKGVCDFCTVPVVPFGWHTRPVAEVVAEVRALPKRLFTFNDVNLTEDREYALELFKALEPLKKHWGALASTRIGRDDELLDAMRRSGCRYLLIGLESVSNPGLSAMRKGFNHSEDYPGLIAKLHARGIIVQGCFIFGLDHDTPDVFRRTVEAVNELKIDIPRYAIYTPYPRTPAFDRLKAQGRLLHEHWRHFDTQHVVIRPAAMSPRELDEGFRWAYRETFGLKSISHRVLNHRFPAAAVAGNLAYRIYVRRLDSDPERILAA